MSLQSLRLRRQFWMRSFTIVVTLANAAFAQDASTPSAPPAPPAPPSATIQVPGQPQFIPTPVIMMNPASGTGGAPTSTPSTAGPTSGASTSISPSFVILPTQSPPASSQQSPDKTSSPIVLTAGTKILLSLQRGIHLQTASAGDLVYLRSRFPVVVQGRVALAAGTYLQGKVVRVGTVQKRNSRTHLLVDLTTLILKDGTVIQILRSPRPFSTVNLFAGAGTSIIPRGTSVEISLQSPLILPQPAAAIQSLPAQTSPTTIPVYIPFPNMQLSTSGNSVGTPPSTPTRYIK